MATDTEIPHRAVTEAARTPDGDRAYQDRILQRVSRTFALTIPQLPEGLRAAVGNAYLLCRIADTIEDDPDLCATAKRAWSERFIAVVDNRASAAEFASGLGRELSRSAAAAERDLIANSERVLRLTHAFGAEQQRAMSRCVQIMARGMADFQDRGSLDGLPDQAALDKYCYVVAGVVGEMLTELFCAYSPAIARHRDRLLPLAVSFGQALQMTNILKDMWEDRSRGACWLPRTVFERHGVDLLTLSARAPNGFELALGELLGVAHAHLRNALTYTLLLPASETGLRRFCLWALGMAVLTLRKIDARRDFRSGQEVKISRRAVRVTALTTAAAVRCDAALRTLFELAAHGLPPAASLPLPIRV
jgi:farnesyl-diphosphate farnesyltransferase